MDELDGLRERLTSEQRAILNALWQHFWQDNEWMLTRVLHHQFGRDLRFQTFAATSGRTP